MLLVAIVIICYLGHGKKNKQTGDSKQIFITHYVIGPC